MPKMDLPENRQNGNGFIVMLALLVLFLSMVLLFTCPAKAADVLVNIDKATQEMSVSVDGTEQYRWPVRTGTRGYDTPSGTFQASSMNEIWYSQQWDNAAMPHSIFFTKEGHAIHGTDHVKNLGTAASHGCVRLSRENAETLYRLVEENGLEYTQVSLTGEIYVAEPEYSVPKYEVPKQRRQPVYPAYPEERDMRPYTPDGFQFYTPGFRFEFRFDRRLKQRKRWKRRYG